MLNKAHQGYYYQDLLGAHCIATEIAKGRLDTRFEFDKKQSKNDLFDDLSVLRDGEIFKYQSNTAIKIQIMFCANKICRMVEIMD